MDDDRMEAAETKLAFMEKTVSDLGALVYEYGRRMDRMENTLRAMRERLVELGDDKGQAPASERPPHY